MYSRIADVNPTWSITTLNVNGLNKQSKGRLPSWRKKADPTICCLHCRLKSTDRLKVKGWEQIYFANNDHNTIGVSYINVSQNNL